MSRHFGDQEKTAAPNTKNKGTPLPLENADMPGKWEREYHEYALYFCVVPLPHRRSLLYLHNPAQGSQKRVEPSRDNQERAANNPQIFEVFFPAISSVVKKEQWTVLILLYGGKQTREHLTVNVSKG